MAAEPDNGAAINGGMWIMTILPLLAISLRLYCKSKLGRVFGWDEYVLITSWVSTTGSILETVPRTDIHGRYCSWFIHHAYQVQ